MEDAFLLLNLLICCKASNIVMLLKENGLEGVNASFIFLILGCLLYFDYCYINRIIDGPYLLLFQVSLLYW